MNPTENKSISIVLFDGYCNLCSKSVQFIIKRDKKDKFRFASLQEPVGKELKSICDEVKQKEDSIILIENGKCYSQSTAALRISKSLNALWPLAYGLIILPKFVRNSVYSVVAKNRYNWFGKMESCMVPTKELKNKFIDGNSHQ